MTESGKRLDPDWRTALEMLRRGCALEERYHRRQGELIRRRVRSLAAVVGVLVVAWIPIDLFSLQPAR